MSFENKISVIIPAYNVEKYIRKAINSVLSQTYHNIEIIVIDDGSTDGTGELLDEYMIKFPEKVKVFHIKNSGVSKARMLGVKYAKGNWIGFVDGDDFVEPDMYETLLQNALMYSVEISHCGYKMFFEDGRIHYFHNTGTLLQQDTFTALKYLLDGSLIEPGLCNKLYKKELFKKILENDVLDYSIKQNEDLLMNYVLFSEAKKTVFYDICKYCYIVRSGSATRQQLNDNIIFDPIRVREYILDMTVGEIQKNAEKAYINTCLDVYNLILMKGNKKNKKELLEVKQRINSYKNWSKYLNSKRRFMINFLCSANALYNLFYKVYSLFFQEKKYE